LSTRTTRHRASLSKGVATEYMSVWRAMLRAFKHVSSMGQVSGGIRTARRCLVAALSKSSRADNRRYYTLRGQGLGFLRDLAMAPVAARVDLHFSHIRMGHHRGIPLREHLFQRSPRAAVIAAFTHLGQTTKPICRCWRVPCSALTPFGEPTITLRPKTDVHRLFLSCSIFKKRN